MPTNRGGLFSRLLLAAGLSTAAESGTPNGGPSPRSCRTRPPTSGRAAQQPLARAPIAGPAVNRCAFSPSFRRAA